tara:strand:- start:524 stop:1285 length:762 start_codon:yes stop_codon:yes gene_type:complete
MNLTTKSLLSIFALFFIVSCSDSMDDGDAQQTVFFNQFISCTAGPDYSVENMRQYVADWNELVAVYDQMVWAGGLAPASGQQNGWWELQWTSKEASDAAWESWLSREDAQEWDQATNNVLDCDNTQVFDHEFHLGDSESEMDWESYATQSQACRFINDASKSDLMTDMALFDEWLDKHGTDDPYTYGVYFPMDKNDRNNFYWLNFHQNFETMEKGNMNWIDNGAEMQAVFDSHTECDDAELWNGAEFKNASAS